MRSSLSRLVCAAAVILFAPWAGAQGNSWNKLRYLGGTVPARVNAFDWNTTVTIKPDSILLVFAPRVTLRLQPSQVTSLSYGPVAQRRVADVAASSLVANPPALFGLLRGSKEHWIGTVYQTDDGKTGAVLLESQARQDWIIVQVLKAVTGKPIETSP